MALPDPDAPEIRLTPLRRVTPSVQAGEAETHRQPITVFDSPHALLDGAPSGNASLAGQGHRQSVSSNWLRHPLI